MQGNGVGAKPKPVLCAGQGCAQARQCMRYRIRMSAADWVSWDIERQRAESSDRLRQVFGGPCPGYVEAPFVRNRK